MYNLDDGSIYCNDSSETLHFSAKLKFEHGICLQLSFTMDTLAVFFVPALIISVSHIYMVMLIFQAGRRATHVSRSNKKRLTKFVVEEKAPNDISVDSRRAEVKENDGATNTCIRTGSKNSYIPRAKVKTVKLTCVIVAGKTEFTK